MATKLRELLTERKSLSIEKNERIRKAVQSIENEYTQKFKILKHLIDQETNKNIGKKIKQNLR